MPEMPDWKSLVEERLRTLRCETPAEPDLTAELAQHLEDYYRELCSGGASEEEAYQRTLSELDDVYPLRAEVERSNRMAKYDAVPAGDARPGNLFEDFCRDLGYGGRAIRKSPLFTLAAVLCLGMGIGANTTVFTIINTLLLHPLPASDPSRLVVLYDAQASRRTQQWSQPGLAYANLQDYMAGQKCFRSVAAFTWPQVLTLAGTKRPGAHVRRTGQRTVFRYPRPDAGAGPLFPAFGGQGAGVRPGGGYELRRLASALWWRA